MKLEGRVALVTGASRGIGKAIAAAFAREGATCVISRRKQDDLAAAARDLPAGHGRVVPIACHVGRLDDLKRLAASVLDQFGAVDILVNNAATNVAQGPCLEVDEGQFDKMVEINLKSVYRLTSLVAPGMCERGRGSIINIASVAGLRPQVEGMLYSMTKAAVIMLTKSYALELGPKGVRVNCIAPGLVQTHLSEMYWKDPGKLDERLRRQPLRHLGQPREIAEAAVLLASDDASYMTGEVLTIDGGLLLSLGL